MDKYKQAFNFYEAVVKGFMRDGMSETDARAHCRFIAEGIIHVAIYDDDITPDQFDEIENWRYGHDK